MFPNKEEVRAQLKGFLRKSSSNDLKADEDMADNCFADIARDTLFRNITFAVILMNTVWIAIDTDYNDAPVLCEAHWVFQVVDNLFCLYFTAELIIRGLAYKDYRSAISDAWFLFDSFLVVSMIWETWISVLLFLLFGMESSSGSAATVFRIFRLFRLTRVARLGRLVGNVPELMFLVKGMAMAIRSVLSTLGLMFIVIYIFAILFTQMLSQTTVGEGKYETVPQSINTLLLAGVFPDQGDDLNDMMAEHWIFYLFYATYLLIGSLTIMNMLIGVLCEVVGKVAEAEQAEMAEEQLKETILKTLQGFDADRDQMVSKVEFAKLLQDPEAVEALHEMGVDVFALMEFSDVIWKEHAVPFEDFVERMLQFRDSGNTTRHGITAQIKEFEERMISHMSPRASRDVDE